MSTNDNGGPAFPYEGKEWDYDDRKWKTQFVHEGMSLRDYFAAKSLQAILTTVHIGNGAPEDDAARVAYLIADAMLKARKQ